MIRPWIGLTLLALTFQPATPNAALGRGVAAPVLLHANPPSGAALRQSPRTVDLLFSTPLDARRSFVSVISDAMDLLNSPATVTGAATTSCARRCRSCRPATTPSSGRR